VLRSREAEENVLRYYRNLPLYSSERRDHHPATAYCITHGRRLVGDSRATLMMAVLNSDPAPYQPLCSGALPARIVAPAQGQTRS
jgi:hypothetical protein